MNESSEAGGALAGLKIVDLSRVLAGPLCSMILGDHGARVIKVEPPQGDDTRRWGPPFRESDAGGRGDASYYLGLNRNKDAMALDLGCAAGRDVLLRLLADADVLIENFTPGTMEKWGLGYEAVLAPRFPRLVHCRVSGFGADGPLGGLPGYDAVLQAMTGLMSVNGDVSTGPMRVGPPIVDIATGLYAVIGVLMALQERQRSGLGQFVDMALYDCGMALLHPQAANYFLSERRPPLLGNSHPNVVPCDKFQTRNGEIFVVIGNEGQFRRFAALIGRPELADDPRFASNGARVEHRAALTGLLADALAERDGVALSVELLRAGVPVGPVLPIDVALRAPHTVSRGMVVERDGFRALGTPVKLSRTPARLRRVPPRFAADRDAILRELGYAEAEISELCARGVTPARLV
ncbi:MAG: CaiB/BaiF CoA transferase family protein [Burkholderiaceae bacterium]